LLHDKAEQLEQRELQIFSKGAFAIDRILRRRAEAEGFRAANAVVFDSHQTRELVIQHHKLDAHRAITIHGGVDPETFRPATPGQRTAARQSLNIARDELLIVWTGRLAPEKNLPLLLDALAELGHGKIKCILVGDGPMRGELEKRVRELGLSEQLLFAGAKRNALPFLHAADMFVFPSRGESFGCALAEAMACALPCIALKPDGHTIRNASAELIEHGVSGLLVFRPNAKSLAAAINTLIHDADLRASLGREARDSVTKLCSWDSAGRKLNELACELTRSGVPTGAAFRSSPALIRSGA
jgi:glycosyltransferase involved in cell wall biosynthesis